MREEETRMRPRDSKTSETVSEAIFFHELTNAIFLQFSACYFASLIQSLFNLPNIQEKILNFDYVKQVEAIKNIDYSKDMDNVEKIKMKKSVELIRAL